MLNAKDFGLPQNRERFFLIGNRVGINTNDIFENIKKECKTEYILKDAISDLPELLPKPHKNRNNINNEEYGFQFRKIALNKTNFSKQMTERKFAAIKFLDLLILISIS